VSVHPTAAALRAAGPPLCAGVLAGDLADLAGAVDALEQGGARVLHIDVGDGRYSPLMIGGPTLVAAVRTHAYKDVHLLVEEPLRHVPAFATAGADVITLQLDAGRHLAGALREIAAHPSARDPDRPIMRGLALPVEAPMDAVSALLAEVDLVLVLGVVPGHRGGPQPGLAGRVRAVRTLVDRERPGTLVSVDGGIDATLAPAMAAAGADLVVSGSALFAQQEGARAAVAAMQAAIAAAAQTPGARQSGASSPSPAAGIMAS
jgi:ribulose-phosphate 3-epimerase